jgi:hypothetical protein
VRSGSTSVITTVLPEHLPSVILFFVKAVVAKVDLTDNAETLIDTGLSVFLKK